MKRFWVFFLVAYILYVIAYAFVRLAFLGFSFNQEQLNDIAIGSLVSGIFFFFIYLSFLRFTVRETLGYFDSDNFDEPTYGHRLTEVVQCKNLTLNQLNEKIKERFPKTKISHDRNAVKFYDKLSWLSWGMGGVAYLNSEAEQVKIVLLPYQGYTYKADKRLSEEMGRLRELLLR